MIRRLWDRLTTWVRPDLVEIAPVVSFDRSSGSLDVQLNLVVRDNSIPVSRLLLARGHGRLGDRSFRLRPDDAGLLREIGRLAANVTTTGLRLTADSVPAALPLLRDHPRTREAQSARDVMIHASPLGQRTYIELTDPDTVVVRENLATSDDRVLRPSDLLPGPSAAWLRNSNEFFPVPALRKHRIRRGQQVESDAHRLQGDEVADFLVEDLSALRKEGQVLADPAVADLRVVAAAPELHTTVDLNRADGTVRVRPEYRSGSIDLRHSTVKATPKEKKYLRQGPVFHRIDHGLTAAVDRAISDAGLTEEADGSYSAPGLHLDEIINVFSRLGILAETEVFRRFRERLLGFTAIDRQPLPTAVRPGISVRDYQHGGYDWLVFLKQYGLPGILADEMGLGKTLQSLLAIAYFKERYGPCPSLVVCPAALVQKWVDESEKFLSMFTALSHAGSGRAARLRRYIGTADVVICSYDTVTRDADLLAEWRWRFVIADEAQRVKNPQTQRARAIRQIPAEARIAITGTPVENRLLDLWAIFDFLAPGYLGSTRDFERQFSDPIERHGSESAAKVLRRKTGPFVMRRLKKHVAHELPDKVFKPLRCELTSVQRSLYRAVLERDLEPAIQAVGPARLSLGNPHIFAVLTKLKQICCHPGLVTGDFRPFEADISGKFDAFSEIVDQIIDADADQVPSKLVGFSQYVNMAGYLREYVRARGRECDLLDGRVPPAERPSLCSRFNASSSTFGMMLTLGSGGVGLDLQSANYVVMYDRWWNPAVEDQAIDRVHRLGQERQVVVVTITTRGTLEERIEVRLERKRNLSGQVIEAEGLMRKQITRDELLELVRLDERVE